jgi:hypothetical protein
MSKFMELGMSLDDGGNSFQQATRLGNVRLASQSSGVTAAGFMDASETVEWYQAKVKGRASQSSTLTVKGVPSINQTLEVYYRSPSKPQGRGKRIATFAGGTIDSKNLKVLPGTYFFKISQTAGTVANDDVYTVTLASTNLGNIGGFQPNSKKSNSSSPSKQSNDLFF